MEKNTLKMIGVSVVSFIIGSGVGGFAVGKILKKKYEEKTAAEIDELDGWYESKVNELRNKLDSMYGSDNFANGLFKEREMTVSEEEEDQKAEESEESKKMNSSEMKEIREKLKKNWNETTNYAAMYKVEEKINNDETEDETKKMHDSHQKNKNRAPKIISEEAVSDLPPTIELVALMYYQENDTLVTENDEFIYDPENFVGDCLTKFGFDQNNEEMIYVMNYSQDTVYEIQKVFGSYNYD